MSVLERSSVVVPTLGRPSLDVLLDALAAAPGPRPAELVLVDDRPTGAPLAPERPGLPPVRVVRTGGGGPARARNLGWRTARGPPDGGRGPAGLATSSWITADLAYRRAALAAVGGFDERFPRAFREDSDLALRVMDTGARLVRGQRWVTHPVRPADRWVSVRVQAGNADDVLMRRLHGRDWRRRADAALGRRPQHTAVTAAALAAVGMALAPPP